MNVIKKGLRFIFEVFGESCVMSRASHPYFNLMLRTRWMNCHFSRDSWSTPSTMLRTSLITKHHTQTIHSKYMLSISKI